MEDRKKVIEQLESMRDYHRSVGNNITADIANDAVELLKEREPKTGKWIPIKSTTGVEAFGVKEMTVMDVRCSVCGSEEDVSFTGYKYCPRCGAKMTGGEEDA